MSRGPVSEIVPEGTLVRYHGSMEYYHGIMTVIGNHTELVDTNGEYSRTRYALRYGKGLHDYIHNVRPESFTVVTEPGILEDEENGHA